LANGRSIELAVSYPQCAAVDGAGKLIAILTLRDDGHCAPSKYFPDAT
jgi:hypothetical protein